MWPALLPPLPLLFLLGQITSAPPAAGLDCYSCGGLVDADRPAPNCAEFREALSWSMFVISCPEDHVCVKTMSLYSGEEDREFRGCGERQSWFGLKHELTCRNANITDSQTQFCFCNTKLCNAAPPSGAPPGLGPLLAVALAAAAGPLRPNR